MDRIRPNIMKGEMVDYWDENQECLIVQVDTDTYQKLKDSRVTNDLKLPHDE